MLFRQISLLSTPLFFHTFIFPSTNKKTNKTKSFSWNKNKQKSRFFFPWWSSLATGSFMCTFVAIDDSQALIFSGRCTAVLLALLVWTEENQVALIDFACEKKRESPELELHRRLFVLLTKADDILAPGHISIWTCCCCSFLFSQHFLLYEYERSSWLSRLCWVVFGRYVAARICLYNVIPSKPWLLPVAQVFKRHVIDIGRRKAFILMLEGVEGLDCQSWTSGSVIEY